MSKSKKILTRLVLILMIGLFSGWLGWGVGYHEGTGVWPGGKQQQVVVPEVDYLVTGDQVRVFMEEYGDTLRQDYGEGFNCFESAMLFVRQAHWEGIPANLMRVDYGQPTNHALLAIPTSDEGWKFIDPRTGIYLKPQIGGDFCGFKITGLWWLNIFWEPVKWEAAP